MTVNQYKREVSQLWQQLELAIDNATGDWAHASTEVNPLYDYAHPYGRRRLLALLGRETAHERKHRGDTRVSLPLKTAAQLLIVENIARGTERTEMPPATIFLIWRDTAAESWTLGYLLREHLSYDWKLRAKALDYARAVKS